MPIVTRAGKGSALSHAEMDGNLAVLQGLVSGAGIAVATSRNALAADNGGTLELSASVTYTLDGSVALPAGVTVIGPASGTATLAATGCTINGAGTSVSITAGQVYAVIPRPSSVTAFVVKGS